VLEKLSEEMGFMWELSWEFMGIAISCCLEPIGDGLNQNGFIISPTVVYFLVFSRCPIILSGHFRSSRYFSGLPTVLALSVFSYYISKLILDND
jgi:hypothetical protein